MYLSWCLELKDELQISQTRNKGLSWWSFLQWHLCLTKLHLNVRRLRQGCWVGQGEKKERGPNQLKVVKLPKSSKIQFNLISNYFPRDEFDKSIEASLNTNSLVKFFPFLLQTQMPRHNLSRYRETWVHSPRPDGNYG